jgi:hypothetical protein
MTLEHLASRIRRLESLYLGLSKEAQLFKDCDCPLLSLERQAYLGALAAACSGLETARVALARARQRLERVR